MGFQPVGKRVPSTRRAESPSYNEQPNVQVMPNSTPKPDPLHGHPASERFKADDEIDMTPMVDVTFLLLIFFMVTAAFLLQKAMQVPPAEDDEAVAAQLIDDPQKDSIVVRIDSDNVYWVGCPVWKKSAGRPVNKKCGNKFARPAKELAATASPSTWCKRTASRCTTT